MLLFWDFSGGGGGRTPDPPSPLDPRMIIRTKYGKKEPDVTQ